MQRILICEDTFFNEYVTNPNAIHTPANTNNT
jgi:hypothetical protein